MFSLSPKLIFILKFVSLLGHELNETFMRQMQWCNRCNRTTLSRLEVFFSLEVFFFLTTVYLRLNKCGPGADVFVSQLSQLSVVSWLCTVSTWTNRGRQQSKNLRGGLTTVLGAAKIKTKRVKQNILGKFPFNILFYFRLSSDNFLARASW